MDKTVFWLLCVVLFLAFIVRLSAAWFWETQYASGGLYYGDSPGYWNLAEDIAHGQRYQYHEFGRIFRMPGYPAVLAAGMSVHEYLTGTPLPYWGGRLIGVFVGVLSVWLLWKIGNRIKSPKIGLLAALGGAIFPEFVLLSVMILSDALFCLLFLLQMYFWLIVLQESYNDKSSVRSIVLNSAGAGIWLGLACLTKPGWVYFTPAASAVLVAFLFCFGHTKAGWKILFSGVVMTACGFFILLPWAARNYRVSGEWRWTTCQGGPSLWDGVNPQADGGSNMDFMPAVYEQVSADLSRNAISGRADPIQVELEVDRRLTRQSLGKIYSDFPRIISLALNKFARTWSPFPNQGAFRSLPIVLIFSSFYIVLLFFSILGLIRASQNRDFCLLFVLIVGYFGLLHVIFVGSLRYRQPVLWVAMVFLALGLSSVFSRSFGAVSK